MDRKALIILFAVLFAVSGVNAYTIQGNTNQSCWSGGTCDNNVVTNGSGEALDLVLYPPNTTYRDNANLVSYWKFNGNGNDYKNLNNATSINGGTISLNATYGQGYYFDGVDDYIAYGDVLDGLKTGFTITFWMKQNSNQSWKRMISKFWSTGGSWVVGTEDSTGGRLRFKICVNDCSVSDVTLDGIATISDNKWHFITATYNSSEMRIYVDGNLDGKTTNTQNTWTDTYHVCVGVACNDAGTPQAGTHWAGFLDEIMVFNTSLNNTQIQQIFNASFPLSGNFTTQGLGVDNNTVNASFSSLPAGTNFSIWYNGSGSWVNICSACGNNTDYTYTNATGGEIRIEMITNNESLSPALRMLEFGVTFDTTLPSITIYSPQNITYPAGTTSIALNVSANEPISTWLYSLNGSANITFTPNTTISNLSAGTNQYVDVWANDASNNWNTPKVYFSIASPAPPSTTIVSDIFIHLDELILKENFNLLIESTNDYYYNISIDNYSIKNTTNLTRFPFYYRNDSVLTLGFHNLTVIWSNATLYGNITNRFKVVLPSYFSKESFINSGSNDNTMSVTAPLGLLGIVFLLLFFFIKTEKTNDKGILESDLLMKVFKYFTLNISLWLFIIMLFYTAGIPQYVQGKSYDDVGTLISTTYITNVYSDAASQDILYWIIYFFIFINGAFTFFAMLKGLTLIYERYVIPYAVKKR